MRLLYLTPYLPIFGYHGCASKTFDDIETLSLKHEISIISFVSAQDKERIISLEKMNCKVYPFFVKNYRRLPLRCKAMTHLIKRLTINNAVDILQCENAFMAKYLPFLNGVPALLTKHQIFPLFFWRHFKIKKNPFILLRIIKNIFEERIWFLRFKKIIFFSEHDKNITKFLIKDKSKIRVIPLGINLGYFLPSREIKKYDACFLGSFLNHPNVDAILYFIYKVLPLIKRFYPCFSLLIIGNNPPKSIMRFNGKAGICFTDYVTDVRALLSMSKIFVNPMRLGSGMRRKLLEAWAMEMPVISTGIGSEGLEAVNGKNILIADNPLDFSKKTRLLIDNESLRSALGKEGRITAEKYHDRKKVVDSLEAVYSELVS